MCKLRERNQLHENDWMVNHLPPHVGRLWCQSKESAAAENRVQRGVVEVRDRKQTIHAIYLWAPRRDRFINCSLFPLTSIGGDQNLETVTTLPSESCSFPDIAMHMSTTRWQSWITAKLNFGLLCSNFATVFFFFCSFSLFTSDILKKFNPNVKGWSKGQGTTNAAFNVAVSGAKISWVFRFKWFTFIYLFIYLLLRFNHFVLILLHRGIPGQVRRLIDNMKNDPVS